MVASTGTNLTNGNSPQNGLEVQTVQKTEVLHVDTNSEQIA